MLLQWRQSRSLKWFLTSLLRRLGREKTRFSEIFINHVTECHWLGFRNSNVSGHHLKQAECVTRVMGHWSIPCLTGTFKLIWILAKEIPSQVPVCDTCISQDCLVIITWYYLLFKGSSSLEIFNTLLKLFQVWNLQKSLPQEYIRRWKINSFQKIGPSEDTSGWE